MTSSTTSEKLKIGCSREAKGYGTTQLTCGRFVVVWLAVALRVTLTVDGPEHSGFSPQVVDELIIGFSARLSDVAMAARLIGDVVVDIDIVRVVNDHAALVGVDDDVLGHGGWGLAAHVEVDGVCWVEKT